MKLKLGLLVGWLLTGANAMACYTVYDGNNRVLYRGQDAPVDMSLPLHQAVARRFPAGASLVFDQQATCTPVSIAQVVRPAPGMIPPNTIRLERTGRTVSPTSAAPLFTDRETVARQNLPHTMVSRDIAMVPPHAAARADVPSFTVVPADPAVARARTEPDTSAMGAGPVRRQTVITEMRDPPMTIIQRGDEVTVQRR